MPADTSEQFAAQMKNLRMRREDARALDRDLTRQLKAMRKARGRLRGADDEITVQRERTAVQRKQKNRFRLLTLHLLRETGTDNTEIADILGCSHSHVSTLVTELKHQQDMHGEWLHEDDAL